MKSEPKQAREKKKGEPKSRKTSEKSKPALAQAAAEPQVIPPPAQAPGEVIDPSANGAANTAAAAIAVEVVATEADPPEEMIRMRAYELFLQRGYEHGHHVDDWLAAERELKSTYRTT